MFFFHIAIFERMNKNSFSFIVCFELLNYEKNRIHYASIFFSLIPFSWCNSLLLNMKWRMKNKQWRWLWRFKDRDGKFPFVSKALNDIFGMEWNEVQRKERMNEIHFERSHANRAVIWHYSDFIWATKIEYTSSSRFVNI